LNDAALRENAELYTLRLADVAETAPACEFFFSQQSEPQSLVPRPPHPNSRCEILSDQRRHSKISKSLIVDNVLRRGLDI
jgi:hypothetical protein